VGALLLSLPCGQAAAATYNAANGPALVHAVALADASEAPSTIVLGRGAILPTSTLRIGRDVTIVGPSSAPGAVLAGSGTEPFPANLIVVEQRGALTLRDVEITGAGGEGLAAIDDSGSLVMESTSVAGNSGPGLVVEAGGHASVRNSTLSYGRDFGLIDDGETNLSSVTVASNVNGGIEARGALRLTNTIVAENKGSGDCAGPVTSADHSLDSDGSCRVGALSHLDPLLARLAANGGPTPTEALEANSPAIGAADASRCPREDQRHLLRPAGHCDIGAYQTGAISAPSTSPGPSTGSTPHQRHRRAAPHFTGVRAHGMLGAGRTRASFSLRAQLGQRHATFTYTARHGGLALRGLTVKHLRIDQAHGDASIRGTAVEMPGHRKVEVSIALARGSGRARVRLRVSSGYTISAMLGPGAITFTRAL
jgi:hypothetical protein